MQFGRRISSFLERETENVACQREAEGSENREDESCEEAEGSEKVEKMRVARKMMRKLCFCSRI